MCYQQAEKKKKDNHTLTTQTEKTRKDKRRKQHQ
jgi:hypothetical protein